MARKNQKFTFRHYVSFNGPGPNGDYKPWEECDAEEKERFLKGVEKKQSKFWSEYFSNHIDEYIKFLENQGIDPYEEEPTG